jgi:hypothetical protein
MQNWYAPGVMPAGASTFHLTLALLECSKRGLNLQRFAESALHVETMDCIWPGALSTPVISQKNNGLVLLCAAGLTLMNFDLSHPQLPWVRLNVGPRNLVVEFDISVQHRLQHTASCSTGLNKTGISYV